MIVIDYYGFFEEGEFVCIWVYVSFDEECLIEGDGFVQFGNGYFVVLIDQGEGM